jgi:hypothetical protein
MAHEFIAKVNALNYYHDHQAEIESDIAASEPEALLRRYGLQIEPDGRVVPVECRSQKGGHRCKRMRIKYILKNAGWATVKIRSGDEVITMGVSYLHDSLRGLAEAAIALRDGADDTQVIFMEEPGEHLLLFNRLDNDIALVEIRWYDDWASWGIHSEEEYTTLLTTKVSTRDVQKEILNVLEGILSKFGAEVYKQKWIEHDFPMAEYQNLKAVRQ